MIDFATGLWQVCFTDVDVPKANPAGGAAPVAATAATPEAVASLKERLTDKSDFDCCTINTSRLYGSICGQDYTQRHRAVQALSLLFALSTLVKAFWGYIMFRRMSVRGGTHKFASWLSALMSFLQVRKRAASSRLGGLTRCFIAPKALIITFHAFQVSKYMATIQMVSK